jgi:hypothetical protein
MILTGILVLLEADGSRSKRCSSNSKGLYCYLNLNESMNHVERMPRTLKRKRPTFRDSLTHLTLLRELDLAADLGREVVNTVTELPGAG